MRAITLFLLILFWGGFSWAQTIQQYEPALLEVYYNKHTVLDTLKASTRFQDETLMLRTGYKHAMWVAPKTMWADSLMEANFDMYMDIYMKINTSSSTEYKFMRAKDTEYLFKNMPEGKNTVYQYFNLEHRIYEEPVDMSEWELVSDSVKIILGYECYLARCQYRGRAWWAWYSPDIPLQEGPWKLRGLPGLILEAYDSQRHYSYTAQGMNDKGLQPVGIYLYRNSYMLKMTRENYHRAWHRFKNSKESLGDKLRQSGAFGIKPKKEEEKIKMVYPAYDLEDTDYPHN